MQSTNRPFFRLFEKKTRAVDQASVKVRKKPEFIAAGKVEADQFATLEPNRIERRVLELHEREFRLSEGARDKCDSRERHFGKNGMTKKSNPRTYDPKDRGPRRKAPRTFFPRDSHPARARRLPENRFRRATLRFARRLPRSRKNLSLGEKRDIARNEHRTVFHDAFDARRAPDIRSLRKHDALAFLAVSVFHEIRA